jgi:hypothetical protein
MGNILTGIRVAARLKSANWQHTNNEELFQCLDWSIDEAYGHVTPDEILEEALRLSDKTKTKSKPKAEPKAEPKKNAKKTPTISQRKQRDEKSESEKIGESSSKSGTATPPKKWNYYDDVPLETRRAIRHYAKRVDEQIRRIDTSADTLGARITQQDKTIADLVERLKKAEAKLENIGGPEFEAIVTADEPPLATQESSLSLPPPKEHSKSVSTPAQLSKRTRSMTESWESSDQDESVAENKRRRSIITGSQDKQPALKKQKRDSPPPSPPIQIIESPKRNITTTITPSKISAAMYWLYSFKYSDPPENEVTDIKISDYPDTTLAAKHIVGEHRKDETKYKRIFNDGETIIQRCKGKKPTLTSVLAIRLRKTN